MKDIIKKVLKESDFDWAEGDPKIHYNDANTYVRWLNTLPYSWQGDFDDVLHSNGLLSSDSSELMRFARIVESPDHTSRRRLEALEEFENYTSMGTMIAHNRLYIEYVVKYSEMTGIPEDEVYELGMEILEKRLHHE